MEELLPYRNVSQTLDENGGPIESDCNAITFVNYGTNVLVVNNNIRVPAPAVAGQLSFYTIEGNRGEIDRTKYTYKFEGAGNSDAIAIRKIYNK